MITAVTIPDPQAALVLRIDLADSAQFSKEPLVERSRTFAALQDLCGKEVDIHQLWGSVYRGTVDNIEIHGKEIVLVCSYSSRLDEQGNPVGPYPESMTLRHNLDHIREIIEHPQSEALRKRRRVEGEARGRALLSELRELLRSGRSPDLDEDVVSQSELDAVPAPIAPFPDAQRDPPAYGTLEWSVDDHMIKALRAGTLRVELNGHFHGYEQAIGEEFERLSLTQRPFSREEAAELIYALRSGEKLDRFVTVGRAALGCECPHCAEGLLLETDGETVRAATPCPYPQGHFPLDVELNVPSGKIVFANDLRRWFPMNGDYYVNNALGLAQTTKKCAELGMAHCYVGNSCPSILKLADGTLAISVSREEEEEEDEEAAETTSTELASAPAQAKQALDDRVAIQLGSICTDLWWWSGADYDELKFRSGKNDEEFAQLLRNIDAVVVDVAPGGYTVRHFGRVEEGDFSHIFRSGEARPRKDFAALTEFDIDAGQIVFNSARNFPTLYLRENAAVPGLANRFELGEVAYRDEEAVLALFNALPEVEREHACMAVADHLLLVIGNGCDVSKRGWVGDAPDITPSAPSVEIPQFKHSFRWYPASIGFSTICEAAGMGHVPIAKDEKDVDPLRFSEVEPAALNPSFRALAFNTLQAIIRYGVDVRGQGRHMVSAHRQGEHTRALARIAFDRLAKRYPEDVPEYCRDLVPPASVDAAGSNMGANGASTMEATSTTAQHQAAEILTAPWSAEQVALLNRYQTHGAFHPYEQNGKPLIATTAGWVEELGGPVVQDSAYASHLDPELLAGPTPREMLDAAFNLPKPPEQSA